MAGMNQDVPGAPAKEKFYPSAGPPQPAYSPGPSATTSRISCTVHQLLYSTCTYQGLNIDIIVLPKLFKVNFSIPNYRNSHKINFV